MKDGRFAAHPAKLEANHHSCTCDVVSIRPATEKSRSVELHRATDVIADKDVFALFGRDGMLNLGAEYRAVKT